MQFVRPHLREMYRGVTCLGFHKTCRSLFAVYRTLPISSVVLDPSHPPCRNMTILRQTATHASCLPHKTAHRLLASFLVTSETAEFSAQRRFYNTGESAEGNQSDRVERKFTEIETKTHRGDKINAGEKIKRTTKATIQKYDPQMGELVYLAPLSSLIRKVKAFSLFTSALALLCQPILFLRMTETAGNLVSGLAVGGVFAFFILATPVLIHWITRKYVTRMYYTAGGDRYTATTISLFLREKRHSFTAAEVTAPHGVAALFTSIRANGRPFFIDPQFFLTRAAYVRLMRYDEPIDLARPREK